MVERSLSMREVPGSIPGSSISFFPTYLYVIYPYSGMLNNHLFPLKLSSHKPV